MPRASGSGKRQQGAAAGHRDTRHDNGLVGPAKRNSGRKSQGHGGHGHGEGSARSGAELDSGHAAPSLAAQAATTNGISKHPVDGAVFEARNRPGEDARRSSLGTSSETSSESCNSNTGTNGVVDGNHRQIDVNALKNVDVHRDSGPLDLAITVLKSLPIQDTLAILIILMHLPSLSLSFIYAIFTFLTFVPPVTTSSGMNINIAEIFEGLNSMPSLVTVVCMDFFFFMVWLFLWQPIQDILLDLAKPVIAITLGGGTSARDGTSRGVTTCFTWVFVHHLIRSTRAYWSRVARHIPENWRLPGVMGESFDPASVMYEKRSPYSLVKSVLGIHILTQGIVRYIREWYLKREKSSASLGPADPEAAKTVSATSTSDAPHEASSNTPDMEAGPVAPPSSTSTNKKKRKQSAQVRLQQPLWAALASTKIVVMKEYELSHPSPEAVGSNATDIHNLGNAPFDRQPAQIWISYIGSDEVCFNTSHFPSPDCRDTEASKPIGHALRPAGIDASKPFYVRVNDAFWQPTRIFQLEDSEGAEPGTGTRWTGDIYGLRPSSKYVCEFVDSKTDEVVFVASIRTVKETQREKDGNATLTPNGQQSLRPDSPATTLRTSIVAAEAKLDQEKTRVKAIRKDWKTRINSLKRDNELAENQLATAGNSDEKHKQKVRQQETQKVQAERDTEQLSDQLKNFDAAPELNDRKKKTEKGYAAEKKQFDAAQKAFKEHKTTLEDEVKAKEVEKSNLNTKRNKIATRIAKHENELANLTDANNRGLNEAERRKRTNAMWEENVSAIEANYRERLAAVCNDNEGKLDLIKKAHLQLQSLVSFLNSFEGMPADGSGMPADIAPPSFAPPNPWNPNPSAMPHYPQGFWNDSSRDLLPPLPASRGPSNSNNFSPWKAPPGPPPMYDHQILQQQQQQQQLLLQQQIMLGGNGNGSSIKARGRSSSMLSDVSGFTQSSEEETTRSPAAGARLVGGSGLAARRPGSHRAALRANGSSGSSGSGSSPVSPS